MEYLILGFLTSLSLILAIGAQNIFVIEQGLKKQYIFTVCLICSASDGILIFLGLFLFHYFNQYFNSTVELIFNTLLLIFLIHFIYSKIKSRNNTIDFNQSLKEVPFKSIVFKTLGFTYLNPHVYSDTVFFLGNFTKNFSYINKFYFGMGAFIASIIFFFALGYLSKYFSRFLKSSKIWKIINFAIIFFMSVLVIYIFFSIINL
jgi:L-lysine exporter family protein LysE/ArgO